MADLEPLILEVIARTDKLERSIRSAQAKFTTETDQMKRASATMRRQIEGDSSAIAASFKSIAGGLAAGIGAREVANMADSYTRFSNSLKVAGLEGGNLAATQDRLFQVAQRNGVELEAVGSLYSRAAQNQKELGAGTEDLIDLTRAVTASLRISGTSTEEASGALMQLGQAFGSPRVQAEEFNSLLDTMQPLLREASKFIDGTGGSLAGLTRKIKDQNGPGVSNVELFRAIIRAMEDLEKTAANTTLTISGAFTNVSNALTKYIGEADRANGATAIITGALNTLAENLDTVTEALAVLAALMLGRYAAGMVAGAASTGVAGAAIFALQARAAGAATSMEALAFAGNAAGRSLLAVFGGPVGLAVTALTVGIGYLVAQQHEADAAAKDLASSIEQQSVQFATLQKTQAAAAAASNELTTEQRKVITATASLTGEVNQLATAWGRVAAQAKAATLEEAKATLQAARRNLQGARTSYQNARGGKAMAEAYGADTTGAQTQVKESAKLYRQAIENERTAVAEFNRNRNARLETFKPEPVSPAKPAGSSGKKKGGKSTKAASGPSADEIDARQVEELSRFNQEELRARADLATSLDDRAILERQLLEAERDERVRAVNNEKGLNKQQRQARIEYIDRLYGDPAAKTGADGEIVVEAEKSLLGRRLSREIREEETRLANDALSRQAEALDAQAGIATGLDARHDLERRALDLQQQIERNLLEEDIATGRIADAQAARANLATAQAARRENTDRRYESPLEQRRREVNETTADMSRAVEDIQLDAVDRLTDGLANASTEYIKLGGIAGSVINGLIRDMIRLAAQQAIFGKAGGGGLLGSIGGLLGIGGGAKLGGVNYGAIGQAANSVRLPGFDTGGYTGDGPRKQVAGFVHKGEYVIPADAVKRIGVDNLAALSSARAASAMAGVTAAAGGQAGGVAMVRVELTDDLNGRIAQVSGPIAVSVVKQNAPAIAGAGTVGGATLADQRMTRRARNRIPG